MLNPIAYLNLMSFKRQLRKLFMSIMSAPDSAGIEVHAGKDATNSEIAMAAAVLLFKWSVNPESAPPISREQLWCLHQLIRGNSSSEMNSIGVLHYLISDCLTRTLIEIMPQTDDDTYRIMKKLR